MAKKQLNLYISEDARKQLEAVARWYVANNEGQYRDNKGQPSLSQVVEALINEKAKAIKEK